MDENSSMLAIRVGWIAAGLLATAWLLFASRHRNDPGRAVQTGGLLTALVGTVTVPVALFVPFGVYTTVTERVGRESEVRTGFESMWAIGIEPFQVLWLAVVWGAAVIVAFSALVNQSTYIQLVRWVATLVLIALTWLSSLTIGWMFVPVTLLALITAIHGARAGAVTQKQTPLPNAE